MVYNVFLTRPTLFCTFTQFRALSLNLFFFYLSLSVDEKRKSKSTPVILTEIAKEEGL